MSDSPPDLSTRWLGLDLPNPLVASSSPLTGDVETLVRLEQAGVAAVVLPSLFQEQLEHEEFQFGTLHHTGAQSTPEASDFFPGLGGQPSADAMELATAACEALSIPVVFSLNGVTHDGWARYARRAVEAGVDAIELNLLMVPTDPSTSAADIERRLCDEVAAVRGAVSVPITVKLGGAFTAPLHVVEQLTRAGADGVSVINRFPEPDLDLERMEVVPHLEPSRPAEVRAVLRWIALLSPHAQGSLAATTGAHAPEDLVKLLLAGADVVMTASALLLHGPEHAGVLLDGLRAWMTEHEYVSVKQMKGSMNHAHCPTPEGYERLNYMRSLVTYTMPEQG